MDRELKKYILFSYQTILVTKVCHPALVSLTRTLGPRILWKKITQKKLKLKKKLLQEGKAAWALNTDKRSHMVKAKSENF